MPRFRSPDARADPDSQAKPQRPVAAALAAAALMCALLVWCSSSGSRSARVDTAPPPELPTSSELPPRELLQLALLIPYTDGDAEALRALLRRMRNYSPCDPAVGAQPVTAFLYHPGSHSTLEASGELRELWETLGPATGCFGGGMRVLHAELPEAVASAEPARSCGMFHAALGRLRQRAQYVFWMGAGTLPVRSGWLDALVGAAAWERGSVHSFWVKGSVSRCDGRCAQRESNPAISWHPAPSLAS